VRAALRARHYSRRTEEAYVAWIKRYVFFFHAKRHPADMGAPEVTRFLSSLAVDGGVAASTQNQALSALLFLYRDVLEVDLPWLDGIVRARCPERLPVVLTRDEVRAVLQRLDGAPASWPGCSTARGSRCMSAAGSGSLTLAREGGLRPNEAWALRLLGEIAARRDPPEHADGHYRDALALAEELGMRPLVAHCQFGLGKLYQRTGDPLEGGRALGQRDDDVPRDGHELLAGEGGGGAEAVPS
jgi:hypothetical protein